MNTKPNYTAVSCYFCHGSGKSKEEPLYKPCLRCGIVGKLYKVREPVISITGKITGYRKPELYRHEDVFPQ